MSEPCIPGTITDYIKLQLSHAPRAAEEVTIPGHLFADICEAALAGAQREGEEDLLLIAHMDGFERGEAASRTQPPPEGEVGRMVEWLNETALKHEIADRRSVGNDLRGAAAALTAEHRRAEEAIAASALLAANERAKEIGVELMMAEYALSALGCKRNDQSPLGWDRLCNICGTNHPDSIRRAGCKDCKGTGWLPILPAPAAREGKS